MGKRIVAPKCPEQELRKKRKVGAEGFEPPSAGFHYGDESSLQLVINYCQQTHFQSLSITGARQSARLAYTPGECDSE